MEAQGNSIMNDNKLTKKQIYKEYITSITNMLCHKVSLDEAKQHYELVEIKLMKTQNKEEN